MNECFPFSKHEQDTQAVNQGCQRSGLQRGLLRLGPVCCTQHALTQPSALHAEPFWQRLHTAWDLQPVCYTVCEASLGYMLYDILPLYAGSESGPDQAHKPALHTGATPQGRTNAGTTCSMPTRPPCALCVAPIQNQPTYQARAKVSACYMHCTGLEAACMLKASCQASPGRALHVAPASNWLWHVR